MHKIQFDSFVWLDINSDIVTDVDIVEQILNLKESTEEIIKSSIHLQRLEEYPDYMAVVLHYPLYDKALRKTSSVEIDCILSPGYFITIHTQEVHFLKNILKFTQSHSKRFTNPAQLYLYMVEQLAKSCLTPLNRIAEKIEYVEEEIFRGNESNMISEISIVKRDVLDFRKTIRLHKPIIDASIKLIPQYFPEFSITQKEIQDILAGNTHIWNITENLKESIEAFDQTNQTLFSNKLNQKINTLTLFSATLVPSSLLVGLLGINARMNFLENSYAFYIVFGIVIVLSSSLYIFFRKKIHEA